MAASDSASPTLEPPSFDETGSVLKAVATQLVSGYIIAFYFPPYYEGEEWTAVAVNFLGTIFSFPALQLQFSYSSG